MKTRILITLVAFVFASCTPQSSEVVEAISEPVVATPAFNITSYAPQNRPDVRGLNGAVSAGHPLAAQAGLRILQEGGNATDAIIAMAGVLAVVRPHMNGIGGDAFGIFYDGETREITALNASGRAGSGAASTPRRRRAAAGTSGRPRGWVARSATAAGAGAAPHGRCGPQWAHLCGSGHIGAAIRAGPCRDRL